MRAHPVGVNCCLSPEMNPLTRVAVLCACVNALYNPLDPPHPPAVILTPLATDCKYGMSSVAEVTVSVAALTLDAVSLKIRFPHDGGAFPCWLSSSDNYSQPHCGELDGTYATITWLCKTNGTQVNPVDNYDYTPCTTRTARRMEWGSLRRLTVARTACSASPPLPQRRTL